MIFYNELKDCDQATSIHRYLTFYGVGYPKWHSDQYGELDKFSFWHPEMYLAPVVGGST